MNPIRLHQLTQDIKRYVKEELDFSFCGIAKAEFLEEEAPHLEQWLKQDFHGDMSYMAEHFDMRLNPQLIVPNAKSVITLLCNYFPSETQANPEFLISKYAYGKDYHKVIKKKLKQLLKYIQSHLGEVQGRGFVDSAPVLERAWAKKAGIGWTGKNSLHITKQQGSFFFLSTLIIDVELEYDNPFERDYCGTCTKCIDHCPTDAIIQPAVVDSNKCISYLTIELKKETIPDDIDSKNWIFGCDICQDVCPWNRFSKPHTHSEFSMKDSVKHFDIRTALQWNEKEFNRAFESSAIRRTKLSGLRRNIQHLLKDKTIIK